MTNKEIQSYLNFLGYSNLVVDGVMGAASKEAISKFQKGFGLTVNGEMNLPTLIEMEALFYSLRESDIKKLNLLHPKYRDVFKAAISAANKELKGKAKIIVTQTLRTFAEQDALYAQGRTKAGPIVTNARGGQSNHNYGTALDFALLVDGKAVWDDKKDYDLDGIADWKEVANKMESFGLEWGGRWRFVDNPHFQIKGLEWKQMLVKWQNNDTFIDSLTGQKYIRL